METQKAELIKGGMPETFTAEMVTLKEKIFKLNQDQQTKLSERKQLVASNSHKFDELMGDKNTNEIQIDSGANVYLSLTFLMVPGTVTGINFAVTITNLTKENRFFNAPFFKLSVPFEGNLDTFVMHRRWFLKYRF